MSWPVARRGLFLYVGLPMNEHQLIAEIYRTAAGLQPWPALMETLGYALNACFAQVVGLHKTTGQLAFNLQSEDVPADARLDPLPACRAIDLHAAEILRLPAARQLNSHESTEAPGGASFPELRRAYGCCHVLTGKLFDDRDLVAIVVLLRGARCPAFSLADERLAARLIQHLAAAVKAFRRNQHFHDGHMVGELLLQRSRRPSLLVRGSGAILFANLAAKRVMEAATVLMARDGRVAAPATESDARLQQALLDLGTGSEAGNGAERAAMGLRDTASGRIVPACLWRLPRRDGRGALAALASGMLVLAESADDTASDPMVLVAMFGLTPAEARVANLLVTSHPPKAIAAALGLSVVTVRHHIRRLLAKTGSSDLRDLTRQIVLALGTDSL